MKKQKELLSNVDWKEVKVSFFKYFKIIALSFFLPLFFLLIINEVAVLSKVVYWLNKDIDFWGNKKKLYFTISIALFPVVHLVRCYFLLIRNIWSQLHKDYFAHWFEELADRLVASLYERYSKGKESKPEIGTDDVIIYINKKVSKLPKFLAWVARKLLDQIPYLEYVHSLEDKDLEEGNHKSVAKGLSERLNEFAEDRIDGIMPSWTIIIIPINILLVIYYIVI